MSRVEVSIAIRKAARRELNRYIIRQKARAQQKQRKNEIQYFLALPRCQFQVYIHVFYHMMSNAAAKVSGLT